MVVFGCGYGRRIEGRKERNVKAIGMGSIPGRKTDSREGKGQGTAGRRIARYQDSKVPGKGTRETSWKEQGKERRKEEG